MSVKGMLGRALARPRALADAAVRRASDVAVWAMCNQGRAAALAGALVGAAVMATCLAEPARAEAIAPALVAVLVAVAGIGAGVGIDAAADSIEDGVKAGIQSCISATQTLMSNSVDGNLLSGTFQTLLGEEGVYETLYNVHHTVFIPMGCIIVAIFFVLGLVKLVSKAGQTDGGIDTWQLVWLFVMYVMATAIVQASWELMEAVFSLSQMLIERVVQTGEITAELADPTEGVENIGALIVMLLVSFIGYLVALIVSGLSVLVVLVRSIQIYLYTVTSPIPLAFMVSEDGREMTKTFMKRYVALLLTGAIMALVFIIFSKMSGVLVAPDVELTDIPSIGLWLASYGFSFVAYVAFGWSLLHSGQWAKDLVGV